MHHVFPPCPFRIVFGLLAYITMHTRLFSLIWLWPIGQDVPAVILNSLACSWMDKDWLQVGNSFFRIVCFSKSNNYTVNRSELGCYPPGESTSGDLQDLLPKGWDGSV